MIKKPTKEQIEHAENLRFLIMDATIPALPYILGYLALFIYWN